MARLRVDHVVTSGIFRLDGGEWEVDNNIWLVGDDEEVVVIDAAHEAQPIIDAVAGRRVELILCTHGHNDHINVADALAEALDAPIALHPADRVLWDEVHPDLVPDVELADAGTVEVAGRSLTVLHTPG